MRALRKDASQSEIVSALRQAGCYVHVMHEPVDLLVRADCRWHLLEVKNPGTRSRRSQQRQIDFIEQFHIPVVRTPEQALLAVGLTRE